MKMVAVDPGDKHQGVAWGSIEADDLYISRVGTLNRVGLWTELENAHVVHGVHLVIVEEFRLYPEMARQQGYSNFATSQVIGGITLLSEYFDWFPVHMAKADVKRRARRIGERSGMPGKIRTNAGVRAWDFSGKTQHERDAIAHLVWWAFRNEKSPLFERDLKKESQVYISD